MWPGPGAPSAAALASLSYPLALGAITAFVAQSALYVAIRRSLYVAATASP